VNRRTLLLAGGAAALDALPHATHAGGTAQTTLRRWSRAETLPLWPGDPPGIADFESRSLPPDWSPLFVRNIARPALHVFRPAKPNGRGILVAPGGAYQFVSIGNEGVEVAEALNALGYTAFILTYRLPGEGWKPRTLAALSDAQRAVRLIRMQAKRWRIAGDALAMIGFSAGGHLAGSLAVRHGEAIYTPVDEADEAGAKPFAVGLIYPVVTMREPLTHGLSRELLLGPEPGNALIDAWSVERHVDANIPPLFLAHALDDDAVPIGNTLGLVEALRTADRPFEGHLFQRGRHAFGIGRAGTPSALWIESYDRWLRGLSA
jgi:acetyl esterase/lipase